MVRAIKVTVVQGHARGKQALMSITPGCADIDAASYCVRGVAAAELARRSTFAQRTQATVAAIRRTMNNKPE